MLSWPRQAFQSVAAFGMILVGVVNVIIAWRDIPEGFDKNWDYADAAVPATAPAPTPAATTDLDAGVSDSR